MIEKHIEGKTAQTRSIMRAHVSADRAPPGFAVLEKCQLIIGDEVGWYFDDQEGRMSDMLVAPAVPPFRQTFVDFRGVPNAIDAVEWGVHLSTVDLDDPEVSSTARRRSLLSGGTAPPVEARWIVLGSVYVSWNGREVVGPVGTAQLYLDAEGTVYRLPLAEPIVHDGHNFHDVVLMHWLTGGDSNFDQQLVPSFLGSLLQVLQELLYAALLAISFTHVKNVDVGGGGPRPAIVASLPEAARAAPQKAVRARHRRDEAVSRTGRPGVAPRPRQGDARVAEVTSRPTPPSGHSSDPSRARNGGPRWSGVRHPLASSRRTTASTLASRPRSHASGKTTTKSSLRQSTTGAATQI